MQIQNLLNNIQKALGNSTTNQSQQLYKKLSKLINTKLDPQHSFKKKKAIKMRRKIYQRKYKIRGQRKHIKSQRKIISKNRLRRLVMNKILNQNLEIHTQILVYRQKQQIKNSINHQSSLSNINSSIFQQEQQKIQIENQQKPSLIYQNKQLQATRQSLYLLDKSNLRSEILQTKFQKIKTNFNNYLKSTSKQPKIDEITCPICIDVLIDPVSTQCGHSFCFKCLDQSLLFGNNCPVCRLHIKGLQITQCRYLNNLIKIKVEQFLNDKQIIQNYKQRLQQREQWMRSRILDPNIIKKGMLIDVRDTQNIWCKANIQKIYHVNGKVSSILIHYLQWAKLYDQIIQIKSIRLAPQNRFSARTDIARYSLNSGDQNVRGAVINSNGIHQNRQPPQFQQRNIVDYFRLQMLSDNLANLSSRVGNDLNRIRQSAAASNINLRINNNNAINSNNNNIYSGMLRSPFRNNRNSLLLRSNQYRNNNSNNSNNLSQPIMPVRQQVDMPNLFRVQRVQRVSQAEREEQSLRLEGQRDRQNIQQQQDQESSSEGSYQFPFRAIQDNQQQINSPEVVPMRQFIDNSLVVNRLDNMIDFNHRQQLQYSEYNQQSQQNYEQMRNNRQLQISQYQNNELSLFSNLQPRSDSQSSHNDNAISRNRHNGYYSLNDSSQSQQY